MSLMESPRGALRDSVRPDLKFKVLIVEDDLCLKSSISHVLNSISSDLSLKWVTTAKEAMDLLQEGEVDFLIADYLLPDFEDGLWIWENCRRNSRRCPFS